MRFFYENGRGDSGHFTLKKTEIPKAIMSAWNIEADLSIATKKLDKNREECELIFSPLDGNEFNNDILKKHGLYIVDGKKYRELRYTVDNSLA
jgi:hypothetical protein